MGDTVKAGALIFADDEPSYHKVIACWEIANQWLGALVCAVSFSLLMDSFYSIMTSNVRAEQEQPTSKILVGFVLH